MLDQGTEHRKAELSKPHTRLTPDESCKILTELLHGHGWPRDRAEGTHGSPFFFTKFGDGALELLYPKAGKRGTCDGEQYSEELAKDFKWAADEILKSPQAYIGDWLSMTSGAPYYVEEYADFIGSARPHWLHFETVLLMRESAPLWYFYEALKLDRRRKTFMGPAAMFPAAKALGASFIETPMRDLYQSSKQLYLLLKMQAPELLIWQGGMAGHIPVVRYWLDSKATCVNLGSALDPLYRGQTRAQQLHPIRAKEFMRGIF